MRRNDYLLCLVVILLALGGLYYQAQGTADSTVTVRITKNNKLVTEQTLQAFPANYTLATTRGTIKITKTGTGLTVTEAPCPDKLCVKQGAISGSGNIVCIPEGVIIELGSQQEGGAHDAVIR